MKYLKVYTDFAEAMEALSDAERGRLFVSMLQYASTGEAGALSGAERFVWPIAKQNIDRAQAELEKRAENGRKGGRPKKATENEEKQKKAKESKKKQTKDNKDKDKDNDKENNIIPLSPKGDCPPKGDKNPPPKRAYGEFGNVFLTDAELDKLKTRFADWEERIERLSRYINNFPTRAKKYHSHYATILTWATKDAKEDAERKQAATSRPNRQRDLCSSRAYSAAELDSVGTDLLGGE